MKKLFALLLILASTTMFGQVIVHNQPVKLKQLALGTSTDSLVVVDDEGLTKYLPISDIQISPNVAIVAEDEGDGLTYFPQFQDRTYKGVGGFSALDFSVADNVAGGFGGLGQQSLTFGYNVTNNSYGGLMIGEDAELLSSAIYGVSQGYGNSIGGYTAVGLGTYLTSTTNYSIMMGHSITATSGGGSVFIGRGLSDATGNSDAMVILGQGNAEPNTINGFNANNVAGMFGVGDLSGAGATPFVRSSPFNAMTWFRDADAGVVQLDTTTIALINSKKATFPRMIPTVEWVESIAGGGGTISGTIADGQVAYGNGSNAIQGSSFFEVNPNSLTTIKVESSGNNATPIKTSMSTDITTTSGPNSIIMVNEDPTVGNFVKFSMGQRMDINTTQASVAAKMTKRTGNGAADLYLQTRNLAGNWVEHLILQSEGDHTMEGNLSLTGTATVDSLSVTSGVNLGYSSQTGLGEGAIWRNGTPWLFSTADNDVVPNIFFGAFAGQNYALHGTGTEPNDGNNVGIGGWSLNAMGPEAYQNTAVGGSSMELLTTGDWNTAVGAGSLYYTTTGSNNTGIGRSAGTNNTGSNNVFLGKNSGGNIAAGNNGVYIGANSDGGSTTSSNEIVIGYDATGKGSNTAKIGNGNITDTYLEGKVHAPIIKWDEFRRTQSDSTQAILMDGNTFLHTYTGGTFPQDSDPEGWSINLFLGIGAGNLTIGDGLSGINGIINTGVGHYTLDSLTSGNWNNAFGSEALRRMKTGDANTAIGDGAMYEAQSGDDNMALGKNALQNIDASSDNVAVGRNAGFYAGTGTTKLTSVEGGTYIGRTARASANGVSKEIAIGMDAIGEGSNTAKIGHNGLTDVYFGNATGVGGAYWNDGATDFAKVRPYAQGFDIEMKANDAFGGGVDKIRFSSASSNATDRYGYLIFNPSHGVNNVSLEFEAISDGEAGIRYFTGDYFNFNGARIEKTIYDLVIDPATTSSINIGSTSNLTGQVKMTDSATPRTFVLLESITGTPGENFTFIQTGAGAITISAENANVSINGVAGGSITLSAQYSSVQIIVKADDEYIAIGDFN